MKIKSFDRRRNTVTVELELADVEFIAEELPQRDGFTIDWQRYVWRPMFAALDGDR